ncbi:IS3 family transposase [Romboutsia timonensis]
MIEELKILIDHYMDYNNDYFQWNLKKLITVQYRNQLLVIS